MWEWSELTYTHESLIVTLSKIDQLCRFLGRLLDLFLSFFVLQL